MDDECIVDGEDSWNNLAGTDDGVHVHCRRHLRRLSQGPRGKAGISYLSVCSFAPSV